MLLPAAFARAPPAETARVISAAHSHDDGCMIVAFGSAPHHLPQERAEDAIVGVAAGAVLAAGDGHDLRLVLTNRIGARRWNSTTPGWLQSDPDQYTPPGERATLVLLLRWHRPRRRAGSVMIRSIFIVLFGQCLLFNLCICGIATLWTRDAHHGRGDGVHLVAILSIKMPASCMPVIGGDSTTSTERAWSCGRADAHPGMLFVDTRCTRSSGGRRAHVPGDPSLKSGRR